MVVVVVRPTAERSISGITLAMTKADQRRQPRAPAEDRAVRAAGSRARGRTARSAPSCLAAAAERAAADRSRDRRTSRSPRERSTPRLPVMRQMPSGQGRQRAVAGVACAIIPHGSGRARLSRKRAPCRPTGRTCANGPAPKAEGQPKLAHCDISTVGPRSVASRATELRTYRGDTATAWSAGRSCCLRCPSRAR